MGRSIKKGPYADFRLVKKVETMEKAGKKSVIKTWSRRSTIIPEMIGDRKSTRLNSSHSGESRMPSSA